MKVRFPNVAAGTPPEAVLVNISGGLTGGDVMRMGVTVEAGAQAVVTSQACEKIYRSLGDDALIAARMEIGSASSLEWLPQPSILFDEARLKRTTVVSMAGDASLLAVEAVVFGRKAMGETMRQGAMDDRWTVRRDGRLIHLDRFACHGEIGAELDRSSVLAGARAMATIRYIATDAVARLDSMRACIDGLARAAVSAWNGMMIMRLVADDGYGLNMALIRVLEAFRGRVLPRAWHL